MAWSSSCQQLPLIRAVPIAKPSSPLVSPPTASITVDLFGSDRIIVDGREPASTRGVSWELFRIVCALPRGKATLIRVASLQYPSDDDQKAAIQRVRENKSNLQKAWSNALSRDNAERVLLLLEDGVLLVNQELVSVDVQRFLQSLYQGNKARKETRLDDAVIAYQRARALYTGPLLAGRGQRRRVARSTGRRQIDAARGASPPGARGHGAAGRVVGYRWSTNRSRGGVRRSHA